MKALTPLLLALACTPNPASPEVQGPPSAAVLDLPEYDRSDWGRWSDLDGDCQDTRQEVLIAESTEPVVFEDDRQCRVKSGRWVCPFTGTVFTDPGALDIDHMVPLKEAHDSGGYAWDDDKKEAYFNDMENPDHLIAVDLSANRSKGSRQPHEWMPVENKCRYLQMWATVKVAWELEFDNEEAQGLAKLLGKVCP